MSDYPYSRGDLLEHPNTYFYTSFEGSPFLDAWRLSRNEIKKSLGREKEPLVKNQNIKENVLTRAERENPVETSELVYILYDSLCSDDKTLQLRAMSLVDKLLKRFELFKRIHTSYGLGFRAIDKKEYFDLGLYILTAALFEKAYSISSKLPYLNVLLKIIDTLCSFHSNLSEIEKSRLSWLISKEKAHIDIIATKVGVKV